MYGKLTALRGRPGLGGLLRISVWPVVRNSAPIDHQLANRSFFITSFAA
jgi:hypothetical protein